MIGTEGCLRKCAPECLTMLSVCPAVFPEVNRPRDGAVKDSARPNLTQCLRIGRSCGIAGLICRPVHLGPRSISPHLSSETAGSRTIMHSPVGAEDRCVNIVVGNAQSGRLHGERWAHIPTRCDVPTPATAQDQLPVASEVSVEKPTSLDLAKATRFDLGRGVCHNLPGGGSHRASVRTSSSILEKRTWRTSPSVWPK
jgi:hypothetical protein